jgi:hypothetical protein
MKDDPPVTSWAWEKAYRGYLWLMRRARWRAAEMTAADENRAAKGRK